MNFQRMMTLPIEECEHFLWGEALWLSQWKIFALPHEEIERNIISTARTMQLLRNFLQTPLRITSWYRPEEYNAFIGGAKRSQHMLGRAVDFQVYGIDSDAIRAKLLPHLADFNIRMEDLPGSSWIHVDTACTNLTPEESRFFKP
jgi:hypothetical protein